MRRSWLLVVTSALVLSWLSATPVAAQPEQVPGARKFASCAALWKVHPAGIARDAKSRAAAVAAGFQAPKVSASVYRANRARLDRDGDGVICPRKASAAPTETTPTDPIVPPNPAYESTATAVRAAGATCMVVRKGGQVVGEWYWDGRTAATQTVGFSTMKALTGTLIGIAQSQGRLTLDQRASDYITEWKGSASEGVTIRQLLSMTSGRASSFADAQNMVLSGDGTRYAIGLGQAAPPGTVFELSDSAVQTLARVLTVATGQSVIAFARDNLLGPMGMTGTTLVQDGANAANMAFNYTTTCRDLSRLSQLYLQGGTWDGRQIVAADYVNQARSPSSDLNRAYGFLFNLNTPGTPAYYPGAPSDAFSFIGDCGQVSAAYPSSGVVVSVMTSAGLLDAFSCDPTGSRVSAISQATAAAGS